MAERGNTSMSALTAGLESARRRSTASDRENLMEGRTYIPRMSKEQKALLIAALQAGAKKRREKRAEKIEGTGFESIKEMRKADRAKFREGRKEKRQDLKDIRKEEREEKDISRNTKRFERNKRKQDELSDKVLKKAQEDIDVLDNEENGPTSTFGQEDLDFPPAGSSAKGGKIPTYKNKPLNTEMMKNNGRIERLKKKEERLVYRGNKAVDEGRDKKADRILGRAAKTENRLINLQEKKQKKSRTSKYRK
jgi:HSP90 family molecular chaperone